MKNTKFAKRIKFLMSEKNLKTRQLAALMQCPETTINAWKSGVVPKWEKLAKLAKILDTNIPSLIQDEDENLPIFSNSNPTHELQQKIKTHLAKIINDAQKIPGGLEHLHLELLIRFPLNHYKNLSNKS